MTVPARQPGPGADLAEPRRAVYRTLSSLFLDPDDQRLSTLVLAVPELRRRTEPLRELAPHAEWRRLLEHFEALSDQDVETMRRSHATLFLSGARDRSVPLEESAYTVAPGIQPGWVVADVQAAYASVGLRTIDAGGLSPDHVSVELDFLGTLCGREAEAWSGDGAEARSWLERERGFLVGHTLRWIPLLATALRASEPGGTYDRIGATAAAFVLHEEALIGAILGEGAGPSTSTSPTAGGSR